MSVVQTLANTKDSFSSWEFDGAMQAVVPQQGLITLRLRSTQSDLVFGEEFCLYNGTSLSVILRPYLFSSSLFSSKLLTVLMLFIFFHFLVYSLCQSSFFLFFFSFPKFDVLSIPLFF